MNKEIERKFLLLSDNYKQLAFPLLYRQGYLSLDVERTVRVRTVCGKGFLSVKGKNCGIERREYEYEIPLADAEELLSDLALDCIIEKYRYTIPFEGKIWEVDEFLGENAGLCIAEIELSSADETFTKPDWIGKEVSFDSRYYNSNLSQNPYKQWT